MGSLLRMLVPFVLLAGGLAPAATTAEGSRILFGDRGRLVLVDPSTGARTDLGVEGGGYDWSPDGNRIAFANRPGGRPAGLSVINADGSARLDLARSIANAQSPQWSPDASTLAFTQGLTTTRSRLYVIRADGSGLRLVVAGVQPKLARWSRDGNRLLFHNRIRRFTWALFMLDLRNGRVRRLAAPIHANASAEWSPDGTRISFVERRRRLHVMRADGTGKRRLSRLVVWGVHSWSPDGSRIAFESQRFGPSSDIWSVAPDGTRLRRLSRGSDHFVSDVLPDWSPDGAKLAFASNRRTRPQPPELHVMNVDGSCEARLAPGAQVWPAPAWRPRWPSGPGIRCHDLRVDARVEVEADRVTRNADRVYRFAVHVVNEGTERVDEARVTAGVSQAEATFVSATVAGGACEVAGEVSCVVGGLPAGESTTVVVRFRAHQLGSSPAAISARVASSEPDAEPAGNEKTLLRYLPFCRWTDVRERTALAPPFATGNLVCGTDGDDTIWGSAAGEIVVAGKGDDWVSGRGGRDQIGGENGADNLRGGLGPDLLSGGSGNDRVDGGPGSDAISGGTGNDNLFARDGRRDVVYCGPGRDRVVADRLDTLFKDCERA